MRIDKYLKVSRLIKRRTVAKEAGDTGRVMLNGKLAKPGDRVKVGDIIELTMGRKAALRVGDHGRLTYRAGRFLGLEA